VIAANPRQDLHHRAGSRQIIRIRRATDLETAASREPEVLFVLACCHNLGSRAVPPPGIAPPFDDHEPGAHRDLAVGDQTLQMKGLVGLGEASTADQGEAGEEPQFEPGPASPAEGEDCCRQADDQKKWWEPRWRFNGRNA